jgi:hypothetical protein
MVRWEAPDTILIALVGRIDGDEVRAVNEAMTANLGATQAEPM